MARPYRENWVHRLGRLCSEGRNHYTRRAPTFGTEIEMTLSRVNEKTGFDYEIEVTVCGKPLAYDPGRTWGDPENCYPPEGGYVEDITAFFCRNGVWTVFDLTDDEASSANEQIMEDAGDRDGDDYDGPDPDDDYDSRFDFNEPDFDY